MMSEKMTTLNQEEIEWLAEHCVAHNEFCIQHWAEQHIPENLREKLHCFLTTAPNPTFYLKYYEFREEWDTQVNHERIAAKRSELGYGIDESIDN